MTNITVLPPTHTDFESAYVIKDYPYGGYRTDMKIWIETKAKKGQRVVSCTLNPKSGQWNKPKAGTYHIVCVLFVDHDDKDHVKIDTMSEYDTSKAGSFLAKYFEGMSEYYRGKLIIFDAMHKVQDEDGIRVYGASPEDRAKFWELVKGRLASIGREDLVKKIV